MRSLITLSAVILFSAVASLNNAHAIGFLKKGPSNFNYNFAEIAYVDFDDSLDGLSLRFSASFDENYAFRVAYSRASADAFDADTLTAGVTYHIQSSAYPRADWLLDAGLIAVDLDFADDVGISIGGGVRYGLSDALELNGNLSLQTAFDSDLIIELRALYEFASGFSGFVETSFGDGTTLGLGLRFYWR